MKKIDKVGQTFTGVISLLNGVSYPEYKFMVTSAQNFDDGRPLNNHLIVELENQPKAKGVKIYAKVMVTVLEVIEVKPDPKCNICGAASRRDRFRECFKCGEPTCCYELFVWGNKPVCKPCIERFESKWAPKIDRIVEKWKGEKSP
jgi:hypothetical protein